MFIVEQRGSHAEVGVPPVTIVVSLLNALVGLSSAAAGFVLDNSVMIVVGIIIGLVGSILIPIAKAINRQAR
jgi:H+-translocating NAD(P) transhydrogenase subunit beta